MSYVRDRRPAPCAPTQGELITLVPGDPAVGQQCLVCDGTFADGDETFYILLGPGVDADAVTDLVSGRSYNALWTLVHRMCAVGR